MTLRLGPLSFTIALRWTPRAPAPVPHEEGTRIMADVVRAVEESVPVDDAELARAKRVRLPVIRNGELVGAVEEVEGWIATSSATAAALEQITWTNHTTQT